MKLITKLGTAALIGGASIALSGCATGVPTNVTRFSALPAPAGQSFAVVQASNQPAGPEFNRYASIIAQQLQARGYRQAASPQAADMLVRVGFEIDEGNVEYARDPFVNPSSYAPYGNPYGPYGNPYGPYGNGYYGPYGKGFYGPYGGQPYYSRFGYFGRRSPFYYGWDNPYWYRPGYSRSRYGPYGYGPNGYGPNGYGPNGYGPNGYGPNGYDADRYTVYKSQLSLNIVRRADNAPLFEGRAQARSQTDEAGVLVPNLIEAMFTGFPGRNGETVRITVPAAPRG